MKIRQIVSGLLVWGLSAAASTYAEVPKFMAKFPHKSFHKLISAKKVVGRSGFEWEEEGRDQLRFDESLEMKLTLFKALQTITTKVDLVTNTNLQIQKFSYDMKTSSADVHIYGDRSGSTMKMRIEQAGKIQVKTLDLQEPVLMTSTIRPFLLMKGLPNAASNFEPSILEPISLSSIPVKIRVTPKAKGRWTVNMEYLKHSLLSDIDAQGDLLSEKSDFAGLPVEALPISEKEFGKLVIEGTKSDLVELAKVPFPKVNDPQKLKKFAVKISGADLREFELNRNRQKLSGNILRIEVEKPVTESLPVQALVGRKDLEKYLAGDSSTPVFDPIIQNKAHEIVGKENDLWKRALLIEKFVFDTLEKAPTVALPNAIEALKTKKGDCKIHSALFTALARAAGVPSRTVVGLVYSDHFYGDPGFYYHAWVEVYTGKAWVSLDPTWNEIPADATHLAFVEGGLEQQVQMTSIMGKIKLAPASSS